MKLLMLDLWHDLREKRLWPVAVALAVALLAMPVLLAKPAPEDAGATGATVAPTGAAAVPNAKPLVKLADAGEQASDLSQFDPRNPFAPKDLQQLQSLSGSSVTAAADALTNSGGSAGSAGSKSTGGAGGDTAPLGGGGGTPDTGGGVTPLTPSPGKPKVTSYTYVADVTFVRNGEERRIRGVKKLAMLPNQDTPLLLFLGVDDGADNAVFLVDSSLTAQGEGHCSPSADDCGVLSLGPGAEHEFVDGQGNSYGLRVDEIRKVKLSRASASAKRAAAAKKAKRRETAHTSVGHKQKRRRFMPQILEDLLTVITPASDNHSSTPEGDR